MSEPITELRSKAPPKLRRVWAPHPPPLVAQRPAAPSEIPSAAMRFLGTAVRAQWAAGAFYALGWGVDSHGQLTQQLRASVLVRMRRGDERAIALWSTPWPIPDGVAVPELPPYDLPAGGSLLVLEKLLAAQEAAPVREPVEVTVRWTYTLGCHWVRPAKPLGVIGGDGRSGWWGANELRARVIGT